MISSSHTAFDAESLKHAVMDEADMAPPPAPMAMPKQAIERTDARALTARLRLPFLGGRFQGQP